MKKVLLLGMVLAFFATSVSYGSASDYRLDDTAVEQVFDQAIEVAVNNPMNIDLSAGDVNGQQAVLAAKSPIVAWVISFVGIPNVFAIHRLYLGGTAILVLAYPVFSFLTLGILNLGDWICLLIDVFRDDLGKHEGSDALFMW